MAYAMRKRNWPERLAGFFAAKEATRKAFGHAIRGTPSACRTSAAASRSSAVPRHEKLLAQRGVRAIHVTITHTATTAAAVVVLEG